MVTLSKDKVEIRSLYIWNDHQVILKQVVKFLAFTSEAEAVSPSQTVSQVTNFKPYQLTYERVDIEAEIDVN